MFEEDEEEDLPIINPWAKEEPLPTPEETPLPSQPVIEEEPAVEAPAPVEEPQYIPVSEAPRIGEAPEAAEEVPVINPWAPAGEQEEAPIVNPFEDGMEIEPKSGVTADEVKADPERMKAIRDYMSNRKGKQYADMPEDEMYDDFINHMRFFNTNEVVTATELTWLYNLDDNEKSLATNAYQVYDELGNMFTNDGWAGAADGVVDYTRAVLTSPSTYAGAMIGRLVVGSATAATRTAAIKTAVTVARKAALKEAATKGLQGTAAREFARKAGEQVVKDTARAVGVKQVLVATGVDAGLNSLQDYLYQTAKIEGEAQDDYSLLQTGLAAAGGFVGGAVAMIPLATRNVSGLVGAQEKIDTGASRAAVAKARRAIPQMRAAATAFQGAMVDWTKSVKQGKRIAKDSIAVREQALSLLMDPDPNSKTSIMGAMMRAGIGIDTRENAPGVAQQLVSFGMSLPKREITKLNKEFKDATGVRYTEFLNIVSAAAAEGGTNMAMFSNAKRMLGEFTTAQKAANQTIVDNAAKAAEEPIEPRRIEYIQSLWRRLLVSHPATTAVNVQGWAQAYGARGLAEMVHGGVLGTAGLAAKLVAPVSSKNFADESLRKSKQLFAAQAFKLRTLFDPTVTREAADEIFKSAPKSARERLEKGIFGGVAVETPALYGISSSNQLVKRAERYADKAGQIAMVKLQDTYTKSFSIISALDKGTRLKYNKSLNEMLDGGTMADIDDDVWREAINTGLKDTFSADYTRGSGPLSTMAKAVESLSNTPGVGFLFPFGRFLNNNLAFVFEYSPIALIPTLTKMQKKGIFADETMEGMSKMIVGTSALAALAAYQGTKSDEGLAWNQEMTSTGDVMDRSNLAPGSAYMVIGRAINDFWNGGTPREGLLRDMGDQLIVAKLLRDIGTTNPLGGAVEYLFSLNDDEAERRDFMSLIGEFGKSSLADIGSGFTRPFDVPNTAAGLLLGNDITPDRRVAQGIDGVIQGATRYVDNLFAPFIGEELEEGGPKVIGRPQQALTSLDPVHDYGPVARLMGDKIVAPLTNIDRMLNQVGLPAWGIQERTNVPEWDYIMNERITPLLEQRATRMMESPDWKKGNLRARGAMVDVLLKTVKSEAREWIANQGPNEELLNERRKFSTQNKDLKAMAKNALGIDKPDTKLSYSEIEALRFWMDNRKDIMKYLSE